MTTATAPATTAEIDVRWEMANYGRVTRPSAGEIALFPTKRHERVGRGLEELAAMLVPDGVWSDEAQDDEDSLEVLIGQTWDEIEQRFKAWAVRYPERRRRVALRLAADQKAAGFAVAS